MDWLVIALLGLAILAGLTWAVSQWVEELELEERQDTWLEEDDPRRVPNWRRI